MADQEDTSIHNNKNNNTEQHQQNQQYQTEQQYHFENQEQQNEKNNENISSYDTNSLKPAEWSVDNELILVEWCDIAQCYKWLNYQSYLKYSIWQAWFTIPVIIMSTVTGTASFAQSSFTENQRFYVQFGIGTINILVGILTTVSQYLKISQLTEAHRVSSLSWDKYARNIRIELSKAPEERMDAAHFMKITRHEFDRLMETSPIIQPVIIDIFKKQFMGKEGTEQRKLYVELRKPDICDTIMSSNLYRHKWYEYSANGHSKTNITNSIKTSLLPEPSGIIDKEPIQNQIILSKDTIQKVFKENIFSVAKKLKLNKEKIEKYVDMFKDTYGRSPIKSEIVDHFKTDMDNITLDRYFDSVDDSKV